MSNYVQSVVDKLSDAVKALINEGRIKVSTETSKIGAKSSPSSKDETYEKPVFVVADRAAALALVDGKDEDILKGWQNSFNALHNTNARNAKVRELEESDPTFAREKNIQKIAKILENAGLSASDARAQAEKNFPAVATA